MCNLKNKKIDCKKSIVLRAIILTALVLYVSSGVCLFSQSLPFEIQYTKSAAPGDAVFVSVSLPDRNAGNFTADVELYARGIRETLFSADLYKISQTEFSAMIPLSLWYEAGDFYLKLNYRFANGTKNTTELPLAVVKKDFVEDRLYLDAQNTAIITDNSTKRAVQIERLNEILEAVNYDAVYHNSTFVFPLDSIYRTSFFGDRRIYEYSDGKSSTSMHYGIDYRAATGTPVYACARGKVVLTEDRITTGLTVVLEHLPGFYSLYYHLDSFDVSEGYIVESGSQIAKSGSTGLSTGPHLHWEVRLLGRPVDPEYFIEYSPTKF
ncbi:MAG: M23 family metallopeptidase [Spirochaetales bacterium]